MNIGKNINQLRQEHHLTQQQFAEQFHISRQAVSNWENNKTFPDLQTLVEISDAFHISLDVLIKEDINFVLEVDRQKIRLKRMKKLMTTFILLALVCMYCLFTTSGALRSAVFFSGHPINAVAMTFHSLTPEQIGNEQFSEMRSEDVYQINSLAPKHIMTGISMENWIIERHGIFKFAKPYGLNGMKKESVKAIQLEFLDKDGAMQQGLEQKDQNFVTKLLLNEQQVSDEGFVFAEGGYRIVLNTESGTLNLYPYGGSCSVIRVGEKGSSYLWLDDNEKQDLENVLNTYRDLGDYSGLWEW